MQPLLTRQLPRLAHRSLCLRTTLPRHPIYLQPSIRSLATPARSNQNRNSKQNRKQPPPPPPPAQPNESVVEQPPQKPLDEPQPSSQSNVPAQAQPSLAEQYLDFTEVAASAKEERERRRRAQKRSMSSIDKKKRNVMRWSTGMTALGLLAWLWFAGREWETAREIEEHKNDVYTSEIDARCQRTKARITDAFDYFNKPAFEPLLPSMEGVPPEYIRPYTLLIELDGVLTGTTWDREHGWRTAKRPGVDEFLVYLSQFYEIAIFTTMPHYVAEPIAHQLDKFNRAIQFCIYRDGTRQYGPVLVKDLSYLGRDLSKVILIDANPDSVKLQPHNGIVLPKWTPGDHSHDKDLLKLLPFLESLAILGVEDVRGAIKRFEGKDIPEEWAKMEEGMRETARANWGKKKTKGGFLGLFSGSLLGGTRHEEEPKSFLDQQRERAREIYRLNNEEFERQRPLAEKQQEEWVKMQAEMTKSSILGIVSGQTYKDQIELQQKMMEQQQKMMDEQQKVMEGQNQPSRPR